MNSSNLLREFQIGISSHLKCILRQDISRQAFELQGKLNCILYLKTRTTEKANWGITDKVLSKLKNQNKPWFIVLLSLKPYTGYLLSESDVDYFILNYWQLNQDGDYKTKTTFSREKWFYSFDKLQLMIENFINSTITTDKLLSAAINKEEQIGSKTSFESKQHFDLKNFIASNPSILGLSNIKKTHIEYSYPSGDRVDVAFELMNNDWSVVEIETEGLSETIVGLFQAIKYKSLQEAVLKAKGFDRAVTGYLVALDIPPETKRLAGILNIKTYEVKEERI